MRNAVMRPLTKTSCAPALNPYSQAKSESHSMKLPLRHTAPMLQTAMPHVVMNNF